MNTIKVGQSEVLTTQLGLGTNKVGGHNLFPNLQDQDGYAVVKTALDNRVQMLDTAFMYGLGRSEEIIGDVLQDYRREQVVIATKAAQDQSRNLKPNNQPAFLKKAVDDALKRLKTDYIDIFYIHFPDEKTPKAEAVAALTELKKAGKIKAVGVSNFSLAQIEAANQDGGVDIVEDHYSLVHRQAEKELLPYLTKNKITFVPYFPLASGLLTGKYNQSDSGKFTQFTSQQFQQIIDNLKFIRQIAEKHQATVAQVILAWYLKNPAIGIVIPGARKPDQVLSNAKAATIELSMEEFDQIDKLFQGF